MEVSVHLWSIVYYIIGHRASPLKKLKTLQTGVYFARNPSGACKFKQRWPPGNSDPRWIWAAWALVSRRGGHWLWVMYGSVVSRPPYKSVHEARFWYHRLALRKCVGCLQKGSDVSIILNCGLSETSPCFARTSSLSWPNMHWKGGSERNSAPEVFVCNIPTESGERPQDAGLASTIFNQWSSWWRSSTTGNTETSECPKEGLGNLGKQTAWKTVASQFQLPKSWKCTWTVCFVFPSLLNRGFLAACHRCCFECLGRWYTK